MTEAPQNLKELFRALVERDRKFNDQDVAMACARANTDLVTSKLGRFNRNNVVFEIDVKKTKRPQIRIIDPKRLLLRTQRGFLEDNLNNLRGYGFEVTITVTSK